MLNISGSSVYTRYKVLWFGVWYIIKNLATKFPPILTGFEIKEKFLLSV